MNVKLLGDSMHKTSPWDNGIGYALATTLLRLPGYAPMLAFNHIVDVPLVVPHAKLSKEEVCKSVFFCVAAMSSQCTFGSWQVTLRFAKADFLLSKHIASEHVQLISTSGGHIAHHACQLPPKLICAAGICSSPHT